MSTGATILEAVRPGYSVGLCLLPTRTDGSKAPAVEWAPFKTTRPTDAKMRAFDFAQRSGFGMIAGPVSGHCEAWDFDTDDVFQAFLEAARACGLGDVVQRIRAGYEDETPNGGRRWIVRYPASVAWQDCTLARRPGRDGEPKVKTLIELPTFAILAPSNGTTHPSGRPYVRRSGDFSKIASVTVDERDALMAVARSFDQMPRHEVITTYHLPDRVTGTRPGDEYNRWMSWPAVLEPAGWTHVYDRGEVSYWCRPGKPHGISASTNLGGSDLFYPFTSSTEFEPEKSYSKFAVHAVLDHGGDFKAAARALGAAGYGTPTIEKNAASPVVVVPAESIIRFRTAAELALEQPLAPAWFVPGFVAPGVLVEVVGKLKASGKTTFVAWMVWALLRGLDFLGHPTRQTAVVWLTEERPPSFMETLKRAGLTARTDLYILPWHDVKHLPWPAIMREATSHALKVGAGVVIVDTVSQFAGLRGDAENNSGDALAAVEPMQEATAQGLAVVALRHERKGGGEVGESGRGSSAFSGAVDIVVAIRRGEGQCKPTVRVLHTLSRFSETPESLVMELTDTGYVALGTAGTVAILEAERALLDRLPDGESAALSLDAALEGVTPRVSRTIAQVAIKNLLSINRIQRVGKGKKGDGYRYFKPVEDSAGTQIT